MYLDLSCPLELIRAELLRADNRKVRAILSLMNLRDLRVSRIEGRIFWLGGADGQRAAAPFVAEDLRAAPRARFKLQLGTEQPFEISSVQLQFQRIEYESASEAWIGEPGNMLHIEPPLPPRGRDLNRLVAAAGQDARNFPLKTARYWICVCGRPNAPADEFCRRCERVQAEVMDKLSIQAVLKDNAALPLPGVEHDVPDFLRAPAPDERRAQLRMELLSMRAQFKSQRNLLIRRSVFLLLAIVLVLLLMYVFEWLGEKSDQARELRPPVKLEQTAQPEDDLG